MSDYMDAYREQQELDEEVRIASEQDECKHPAIKSNSTICAICGAYMKPMTFKDNFPELNPAQQEPLSKYKDFWVLKQTNQMFIVRAETSERAQEIVRTRPRLTTDGEVLQAHGVVDNEGFSSLIFTNGLPDIYQVYENDGEIKKS